jgi:predicted anti-sigma-YlaC factor YlaD
MKCEAYRNALSARLDNEALGMTERELDKHLAMCPGCRQWADSAERLTRRLRVGPAETIPDLSARVIAAITEVGAVGRWQRRRLAVLRAALAVVAVTQLCLTLWIGTAGGRFATPLHVDREAGAWNLALAVGLFAVVWHVRRAGGVLPLLGAVVAVMFPFGLLDVARGHAGMTALVPHVPLVVALILVALLTREPQPPGHRVRYRIGPPLHPTGSEPGDPPDLARSRRPAPLATRRSVA